ncbi:MAG TPA: DUF2207 domain-containing protein, partial [Thermoanaerobaculia bacterium]|nr:DUF2207 domain-containing protein [Thermoanaerobaculia bacterium]
MNPSNRLATVFALAALCLPALPASSQERSLYWQEVAVRARLDAQGTLHVEERQTMVFTGDWNGGERRFHLRMGEDLELRSVSRIDPETGAAKPLAPGDLSQVDQYDWTDSSTLRWRSRQPTDPPFESTAITYVLDYTLSGILEERSDLYRFRHDFVFPDRVGAIERFVLDLEIDPVWTPQEAVPAHLEKRGLAPGESVIVGTDLALAAGAKAPGGVHHAAPAPLRYLLFALALGAMTTLYFSLRQREAAFGRYAPLPAVPEWDEAWLRENLFSLKPEQVGALWDRRVGPPEVAAVLARLVGEGKLASEIRPQGILFFKKDVLHLRLVADRGAFVGYERELIDKLFFGGRTETDTEAVRQHYRRSGFNPAGLIGPDIENALGNRRPKLREIRRLGGWKRTAYLALAVAVLFGLGAVSHPERTLAPVFVALFISVWLSIFGLTAAVQWRKRVESPDAWALTFVLPGLLFYLVCAALVCSDLMTPPDLWTSAGLALLPLVLWSSLLNNARARETAEAIRDRKLLAAIRRQLAQELESPTPRLQDEWLPYLLAFGLGTNVDRWFRSFGGSRSSTGSFSSSGSSFGSSGGSSGWTGGGGAFGGGGSTSSWAAAATGLAAGVSSSSSSSGGGGGGGGGSSGGGG